MPYTLATAKLDTPEYVDGRFRFVADFSGSSVPTVERAMMFAASSVSEARLTVKKWALATIADLNAGGYQAIVADTNLAKNASLDVTAIPPDPPDPDASAKAWAATVRKLATFTQSGVVASGALLTAINAAKATVPTDYNAADAPTRTAMFAKI